MDYNYSYQGAMNPPVAAQQGLKCDFCGAGHANGRCVEAYYETLGNEAYEEYDKMYNQQSFQWNSPDDYGEHDYGKYYYGENYNPSWSDHQNSSWSDNQPDHPYFSPYQSYAPYQDAPYQNDQYSQAPSFTPEPYQPPYQRSFSPEPSYQYQLSRENPSEEGRSREAEYPGKELDRRTEVNRWEREELMKAYENLRAKQRSFQIQIDQLVEMNDERPLGILLSDTIPNPNEQDDTMTLSSGEEIVELTEQKMVDEDEEEENLKDIESEKGVVVDDNEMEPKMEDEAFPEKPMEDKALTLMEKPMEEPLVNDSWEKFQIPQLLIDPSLNEVNNESNHGSSLQQVLAVQERQRIEWKEKPPDERCGMKKILRILVAFSPTGGATSWRKRKKKLPVKLFPWRPKDKRKPGLLKEQ